MQKFMQTSYLVVAATLLLAGCNKPAEQAANSGESENSAPANQSVAEKPIAPAPNSFSPEDAANGTAAGSAADKVIPAAFQGRWGLVPGDCGPDASIAKGLMVVDGKQLRFYESVGKPAVVTNPVPNRMEGRFSFTGEGMDWSKDMVLTLEGDGDRLVRAEKEPKASYSYKRCPA